MHGWLIIKSMFFFTLPVHEVNKSWIAISFGLEAKWNDFWGLSQAGTNPSLLREVEGCSYLRKTLGYAVHFAYYGVVNYCFSSQGVQDQRPVFLCAKGYSRSNMKKSCHVLFLKVFFRGQIKLKPLPTSFLVPFAWLGDGAKGTENEVGAATPRLVFYGGLQLNRSFRILGIGLELTWS